MIYSSYAGTRMLVLGTIIMGVGGIVAMQASETDHAATCKNCLDKQYTIARDSIVRAWTVLDTLRSMTIEPKDRAPFMHKMFNDIVAVTHALAALASSCQFCSAYYRQHHEDIDYLEEILGYMVEAFEAVCIPHAHGEEKLVYTLMECIVHSMETIRHAVGLT